MALAIFLIVGFFQLLIVQKFFGLFADYSPAHWDMFMRNFHMSGFDPITYSVLTDWHQGYDVVRHPLLAFMMYPLALLNQLLWMLTGVNCCQLITMVLLMFCSEYAFLFVYRIAREIVGVSILESWLLTLLFMSFAFVLISAIVPDHFCVSMFLVLLTLYRGGWHLRRKECFSWREALLLFVITSGVTLSNGVAVGIIVWVVNGWKIFRWRFLVGVFIVPSLLLLATGMGVYKLSNADHQKPDSPIAGQVAWIKDVSRWDVTVENFFGESLMLHREHILGDVLTKRPVIVTYSWNIQYFVECILVLLLSVGLVLGLKDRFVWAVWGILGFNIALHLLLGFAIDEVYIMAAHWAFVIPVAMAYVFRRLHDRHILRLSVFMTLTIIMLGLWTYHTVLLYRYLTWPLV